MDTPLKLERVKRGLSGEQVAAAVNVRQATLSRVENGKRKASPELADKLAKYFKDAVTRDQILFPEYYTRKRAS